MTDGLPSSVDVLPRNRKLEKLRTPRAVAPRKRAGIMNNLSDYEPT